MRPAETDRVPLLARFERGGYGAAAAFIVFVIVGVSAAALSSAGLIAPDQASLIGVIGLLLGIVAGYRAYRTVWTRSA